MKTLTLFTLLALLVSGYAFGVDGQFLINQSTVMAAGGFPYKITQSGSYKLSGNLAVSGSFGIVISAPNVTIDLNGFTIYGGGPSIFDAGISATSDHRLPGSVPGLVATGVTIRNGIISGFANPILSGPPFGPQNPNPEYAEAWILEDLSLIHI